MSPHSISIATSSSSAEWSRPIAAWGRLARLAGATLWWFLVWVAGSLLTLPFGPARRAFRRWVFRRWALRGARILRVRTFMDGRLPSAPFFLVSNHLSYLDILVYAATGPARFVAKREVGKIGRAHV